MYTELLKELLLVVACIPIIIMCMYIYNKDRDKEPTKILKRLFLYGILSIIPIIVLELVSDRIMLLNKSNPVSLFLNIFVSIALIEEGAKWVIVNKAVYEDIEFNHAYDAIIYSVFVSLGFALVENILYVFGESIFREGVYVAILRGLTTIPDHTFNGILMGYFLGKSKQADINKDGKLARRYMLLSLMVPVLAHSIYDFFIFMETTTCSILFLVFVIILYIISVIIVRKVSILEKNFDGSKFDSKERKKVSTDPELFGDTLLKALIITLVVIVTSAGIILF